MAGRKTQPQGGARHFGLTAPYALAGAAQAPQTQDETDTALASFIRTKEKLLRAQMVGAVEGNHGQAPTQVPQPASLTEAVNAATAITEMHKGVAEVAQAVADNERERRIEAENSAAGAFQAGKEQAEGVATMMLEMVRQMADSNREALIAQQGIREEMNALIREADKRADQAERDALSRRLDQMEDNFKRELGTREAKIAELTEKLERFQNRSPQDVEAEYLNALVRQHKFDHPALREALGFTGNGEEPFERTWQREAGQLELAKLRRQHNKEELLDLNAVEHDQAVKEQQRQLLDRFGKALDLGINWLQGNLGPTATQGAKAGLPHNGFGGTMEDMARQAAQIAQAQAAQQGGAE